MKAKPRIKLDDRTPLETVIPCAPAPGGRKVPAPPIAAE